MSDFDKSFSAIYWQTHYNAVALMKNWDVAMMINWDAAMMIKWDVAMMINFDVPLMKNWNVAMIKLQENPVVLRI